MSAKESAPMKRPSKPTLSAPGTTQLQAYATALASHADLSPVTVRNYLSDLQQFAAWCEATWAEHAEQAVGFMPAQLTTPLITRYRTFLQHTQQLRPATINRSLMSIKGYTSWAAATGQLAHDPAQVVKLIPMMPSTPRHLSDTEVEALIAAALAHGSLRDQTILTVMLHTGVRAHEICRLERRHITLGKRSGTLAIYGKRNKYREVPLNQTARAQLRSYLATHPEAARWVFCSTKTGQALTERALGYLVAKYASHARLNAVHPHDLRHRFGYQMAARVPLHRLAQIMGHDSL
ncbi:tyrosine-type recombinase/integrase, partial [Chloroflexia bacterium SDU3-3]